MQVTLNIKTVSTYSSHELVSLLCLKDVTIIRCYINFSHIAGDVAFRILERINDVKRRAMQDVREDDLQEQTQIYVCDINSQMLNVGKKRAIERGKYTIRHWNCAFCK